MKGIEIYDGEVPLSVGSVWVKPDRGEAREARIFPGPVGVDANFVVFFLKRATGTFVAKDANGKTVGKRYLCPVPLTGRGRCPIG